MDEGSFPADALSSLDRFVESKFALFVGLIVLVIVLYRLWRNAEAKVMQLLEEKKEEAHRSSDLADAVRVLTLTSIKSNKAASLVNVDGSGNDVTGGKTSG